MECVACNNILDPKYDQMVEAGEQEFVIVCSTCNVAYTWPNLHFVQKVPAKIVLEQDLKAYLLELNKMIRGTDPVSTEETQGWILQGIHLIIRSIVQGGVS